MSLLETLERTDKRELVTYKPYYSKSPKKSSYLPYGISLYKLGSLEGARKIEGAESIPFVASWTPSKGCLPSGITECRVQFDGSSDFTYKFSIRNDAFVDYLLDVIIFNKENPNNVIDFPQSFYSKLLGFSKVR
jgi:hypothetical protein